MCQFVYLVRDRKLYIVGSGDGYFVRFDNGSPLMDTEPMNAARMEVSRAEKVIERLETLGLAGRLIPIVYGRMR